MDKWSAELSVAQKAAVEAGKAILSVRSDGEFTVEDKGDRGGRPSPVTSADLRANEIIHEAVAEFGYGWRSEESKPQLSKNGVDCPALT